MRNQSTVTDGERKFIEQSDSFLERLLRERGYDDLSDVENITDRLTFPLPPTILGDFSRISPTEKIILLDSYKKYGVTYFVNTNPDDVNIEHHPVFSLVNQLKDAINLNFPIVHPLENHKEVLERFGKFDQTVKIYDLPKPPSSGYKEVAETNKAFAVHSDGLGSGNNVENFILYCESAPLFGGFTCFYDLLGLALCLARQDYDAFRHLFLPTAITAIRPRGKGAIKVVSPILYLDDTENPNAFFRKNSGEYEMRYYQGSTPFARGLNFLLKFTEPFCNGSYFVGFSAKGQGIISRNLGFAHGRTPFIDGNTPQTSRLLSRKWFMKSPIHQQYKHIPGMFVSSKYANLFPEYFGQDKLVGEWNYHKESDINIRHV